MRGPPTSAHPLVVCTTHNTTKTVGRECEILVIITMHRKPKESKSSAAIEWWLGWVGLPWSIPKGRKTRWFFGYGSNSWFSTISLLLILLCIHNPVCLQYAAHEGLVWFGLVWCDFKAVTEVQRCKQKYIINMTQRTSSSFILTLAPKLKCAGCFEIFVSVRLV